MKKTLSWALNADGSLNAEAVKGKSFDARGYRMRLDRNGAPRFSPAAPTAVDCNDNWDPRFGSAGASDTVLAIAADGEGNLYVGGEFRRIGNIQARGSPDSTAAAGRRSATNRARRPTASA